MGDWIKTGKVGVRVRDVADGKKQYLAEWRDHAGKRHSKAFDTQREAVAAREQARATKRSIVAGTAAPPPEAKTFGELADHWLTVKAAKKSIRDDRSMINAHLRPHFGDAALPTINKALIDLLYTDLVGRFDPDGVLLQPGRVSKKTAWNILTLLGSMLREAKKQTWIASVPHVERPKLDQQDFAWIDVEQVGRLITQARADAAHPQLAPMIGVAAYAGLRAGEILGLTWDDVDFDARRISVRRSYDDAEQGAEHSTKSGQVRYVPVLGLLDPLLRAWRDVAPASPWLFPTRAGQPRQADDRHTKEYFHAALEAAGIDGASVRGGRKNGGRKRGRRAFTFHDLRHSFASNWMRQGGDIFTLSKILGHSSVTITMRYAHLAPDAFDGITVLGGVGRGGGEGEATAELAALRAEVERLRAENVRLTEETQRQQRMLDRLLGG